MLGSGGPIWTPRRQSIGGRQPRRTMSVVKAARTKESLFADRIRALKFIRAVVLYSAIAILIILVVIHGTYCTYFPERIICVYGSVSVTC